MARREQGQCLRAFSSTKHWTPNKIRCKVVYMETKSFPRTIPLLMSRQVRPQPKDRIQLRFEEFHKNNPHVYTKLVALARQVKARGRKNYGIESIYARLRWELEIETTGDSFKLNDHYTSRYARLIMEQEPDLKGFFHIRTLTAPIKLAQKAA